MIFFLLSLSFFRCVNSQYSYAICIQIYAQWHIQATANMWLQHITQCIVCVYGRIVCTVTNIARIHEHTYTRISVYWLCLAVQIHLAAMNIHCAFNICTCKLGNKRKCFSQTFSNEIMGNKQKKNKWKVSSAWRHASASNLCLKLIA